MVIREVFALIACSETFSLIRSLLSRVLAVDESYANRSKRLPNKGLCIEFAWKMGCSEVCLCREPIVYSCCTLQTVLLSQVEAYPGELYLR